MSSVKIEGNASGTGIFTIASPNSNTNRTLTIPDATTTIVGTDATQTLTNKTLGSGLVAGASLLTSGTAITLTNQTAPEFTGLPSWIKRITVIFNAVSTNGTSNPLIQIGISSGITTSGYTAGSIESGTNRVAYTTGFGINASAAANSLYGHIILTNINSNNWVASHNIDLLQSGTHYNVTGGGGVSLSATLDRVRITTVNGTDQFDAGTINIFYE